MAYDPNFPPTNAEIVSAQFRAQFQGLLDAAAPIGSLKEWLKNFPNTPPLSANWAECNGQVLNDPQSPYNGIALPDLNGATGPQRFLRGASASGGTGGSDTMNLGGEVPADNNQDASTTSVASAPQPDLPILPSYYEVVYVMRVK